MEIREVSEEEYWKVWGDLNPREGESSESNDEGDPPTPTGWPWPLDGVQAWFEDLWNWISQAAFDAVTWVRDRIYEGLYWVLDALGDSFNWIYNSIVSNINWLRERVAENIAIVSVWVQSAADMIISQTSNFVNFIISTISEGISWLSERISDVAAWIAKGVNEIGKAIITSLTNATKWLHDQLAPAIAAVPRTVKTLFDGAVAGIITGLLEPLQKFFNWVVSGALGIVQTIAGFIHAAADVIGKVLTGFVRVLIDKLTEAFIPASPATEIAEAVDITIHTIYERLKEEVVAIYESPIALAAAPAAATRAVSLVTTAALTTEGAAEAADAVHPTKRLGISRIVRSLARYLGLATIASMPITIMLETGLFRPLRYYYNQTFAPWIPDARELINAAVRRVMPEEEYITYMRWHGLAEQWSMMLLNKAYHVPSFSEAREMLWRGVIPEAKFEECLRYAGIREDFVVPYKGLIERIPGPGDLIRFVVREVIPPAKFTELMKKQGFIEEVAKWFWDAHWVLPPPERTWDAFLRDVITEDAYRRFLIWYDYSPEPRPGIGISDVDIMLATQYDLPGRIDIRWMYEWGHIDKATFRKLVAMRGIDPDWIDKVTDAETSNVMREEIMGLIREAIYDRRDGVVTNPTFRERLRALRLPDVRIDYYLSRAISMYERKVRERQLRIYEEQFKRGILTEHEYRARLSEIFAYPERVEQEIVLAKLEISAKPRVIELKPEEEYVWRVLKEAGFTIDDILFAEPEELGALAKYFGVTWKFLIRMAAKVKGLELAI